MARHYRRKILIKTMKQYIDFKFKNGDTLLIFPDNIKHNNINKIKKEKVGFVCIHSRGNGNTYDHYWGVTELNAVNNLYKYLLEKEWIEKPKTN